ncbi:acyltransferase family protein [soil metagenome]
MVFAVVLSAPFPEKDSGTLRGLTGGGYGLQQARDYRRDIDGLRSIAVLPVVIFHIAQSFLPGGFVGVDIFFVISGYLISAHIIGDARAGRFSPFSFYSRRIRRILPAFLALLAVVTAVVAWRFFPAEASNYGEALLAALASVSNIYFWSSAGYFAPAAESLPLLHTWSLAVEEQFYLVFPLLVLGVMRWAPRRLPLAVIVVLVASLILSVVALKAFPLGGFYLLPTRAWELLIGTVLALGVVPDIRNRIARNLIGVLGVALIGAAMLLYSPGTPFPGIAALAPCLGAALVIHSGRGEGTIVSRALSLPPLVFIGLISYSLYLWHWPIMVFQRSEALLLVTDSKMLERGAVLAASLVAATLSWWLVERPTRNRAVVSDKVLFGGVGASVVALVVAGVALVATQGLPGRFPPDAARMAAWLDHTASDSAHPCFFQDARPFSTLDRGLCLPDRPGRPTYLIVGDSHGGALAPAIREAFPDANILQISVADCLPVLPVKTDSMSAACEPAMRFAMEELPRQRRIDAIWLIGRVAHDNVVSRRVDAVVATADTLTRAGQRVVIVGPNPEYGAALPRILARSMITGDASAPDRQMSGQPFEADALFKAAVRTGGFGYVSLTDALCRDRHCRMTTDDGSPLLLDTDHATPAGARVIAAAIREDLIAQSRRP